jgi:hypothetical protein
MKKRERKVKKVGVWSWSPLGRYREGGGLNGSAMRKRIMVDMVGTSLFRLRVTVIADYCWDWQ